MAPPLQLWREHEGSTHTHAHTPTSFMQFVLAMLSTRTAFRRSDTRRQIQWFFYVLFFLPGCKHTGSSQCDVYSWDGDGGWLTAWRWEKRWRGERGRVRRGVTGEGVDVGLSFHWRKDKVHQHGLRWDKWVQVLKDSQTGGQVIIKHMKMMCTKTQKVF